MSGVLWSKVENHTINLDLITIIYITKRYMDN
jgi:hypothetical protein